jgi:hypothetical protein
MMGLEPFFPLSTYAELEVIVQSAATAAYTASSPLVEIEVVLQPVAMMGVEPSSPLSTYAELEAIVQSA